MAEEKKEKQNEKAESFLQPVNVQKAVVKQLNDYLKETPGVDQWQYATAAILYALQHRLKIVGVHLVEEGTKTKTK